MWSCDINKKIKIKIVLSKVFLKGCIFILSSKYPIKKNNIEKNIIIRLFVKIKFGLSKNRKINIKLINIINSSQIKLFKQSRDEGYRNLGGRVPRRGVGARDRSREERTRGRGGRAAGSRLVGLAPLQLGVPGLVSGFWTTRRRGRVIFQPACQSVYFSANARLFSEYGAIWQVLSEYIQ